MAGNTLTRAQLDALRRRLEDERRRLLEIVQEPLSSVPPDEPTEFEETAQREEERDHELDVDEPEQALLAEVERALAKMDAGTYGISETTGAPISYERLEAVPWAREGLDES